MGLHYDQWSSLAAGNYLISYQSDGVRIAASKPAA